MISLLGRLREDMLTSKRILEVVEDVRITHASENVMSFRRET